VKKDRIIEETNELLDIIVLFKKCIHLFYEFKDNILNQKVLSVLIDYQEVIQILQEVKLV